MGIRLTVDVFSGRPNPTVEVSDRAAAQLLDRLTPERRLDPDDLGLPDFEPLGFRGVVVSGTGRDAERLSKVGLPTTFRVLGSDLVGRNFAMRATGTGVTEALLDPNGPFARAEGADAEFFATLPRLVEDFVRMRTDLGKIKFPEDIWGRIICQCAPPTDLAWWNDPVRCPFNNCYNYGSNVLTNSYAQPGKGAGEMYSDITGPEVLAAAVRDGLIDTPDADNECPTLGHLVALVIAPGWDFHWYRKGRTGRWSHKPGGTPATVYDNSGHRIFDPRTADRGMYTEFTSFMVAVPGHVTIS